MRIPISVEQPGDKNGVFDYIQDTPSTKGIAGIFSFSLYLHEFKQEEENIYIKGISYYLAAVQKEKSVFRDWKVLIYTDPETFLLLQKYNLLQEPEIHYCVVSWPLYEEKGNINGYVLRCMRLRAFFDFSAIPVFIRDADTLLVVDTNENARNMNPYIPQHKDILVSPNVLYEWEANYLEGAAKHPNTYFFASNLYYKNPYHENIQTKRKADIGAFAGCQSSMPVVPCFTTLKVWEQAIQYILSHPTHNLKKNRSAEGRDEQILLFIFLPACKDNIFFFDLDYVTMNLVSTRGVQVKDPAYPLMAFEKGSNVNVNEIFKKSISVNFKQSFSENVKRLKEGRENVRKHHVQDLREIVATIQSDYNESLSQPGMEAMFPARLPLNLGVNQNYRHGHSTRENKENNDLLQALLQENERAKALLVEYRRIKDEFRKIYGEFWEGMVYRPKGFDRDSKKAELQAKVQERDAAVTAFLKEFLTLLPEGEKNSKLNGFYDVEFTPTFREILQKYVTKHVHGGARRVTRKKKRSRKIKR